MAKKLRAVPSLKKVYLTQIGLEEIKTELAFLKKEKRVEVSERIRVARELGDPTENAEYEAALDQQALVENRIAELENILRDAQIIKPTTNSGGDIIIIGSTVVVEIDKQIDEFTIVGKVEANPAKKRISNESPVGSALLGAKMGEIVEVTTPIVKYKCKVLEIK